MKHNHRYWLPLAIVMLFAHSVQASETWSLASSDAPTDDTCQLITPKLTINDGQGDTTVWLEMNQSTLTVKTGSNLDTSFKDVGLQVDQEGFIPFDEIQNETDVVFSKSIAKITQQFIEGQSVQISLRFWPTWPATGVKTATFSLIGFTKVHQAGGCKPVMPSPSSAADTSEEDKK